VGGARTALFNWLFTRHAGGAFVLRIEDTDAARSSVEMVREILDGLRWLGLNWDEGPETNGPHAPYFQAQRVDRHRAAAERLVATGHAYYCYCDPQQLERDRDIAQAEGRGWSYARTCRNLAQDDAAQRERAGTPRAIRFKVPDGRTAFDDVVRGRIEFDHDNIEDFVILRSDRTPTYQLSVVVDDVDMEITYVIRGDDHISNTPKQVLIYRALGAQVPAFAHVPLILGPDKKRLSKRHGATSVTEYKKAGYLAEAMVNFLALLGWSPGGDREVLSRDELITLFALEGISGGNAVFNVEKLDWFNQQYMLRLSPFELGQRVKPYLEQAGLWSDDLLGDRHAWFFAVLELLKVRAKRLDEYPALGRFFFSDDLDWDAAAVRKHLGAAGAGDHFAAVATALRTIDTFDAQSIETAVRAVAEARGVKAATLIHALRVAMTGKTVSPGLFEVAALLGRDRVQRRLRAAIDMSVGLHG